MTNSHPCHQVAGVARAAFWRRESAPFCTAEVSTRSRGGWPAVKRRGGDGWMCAGKNDFRGKTGNYLNAARTTPTRLPEYYRPSCSSSRAWLPPGRGKNSVRKIFPTVRKKLRTVRSFFPQTRGKNSAPEMLSQPILQAASEGPGAAAKNKKLDTKIYNQECNASASAETHTASSITSKSCFSTSCMLTVSSRAVSS